MNSNENDSVREGGDVNGQVPFRVGAAPQEQQGDDTEGHARWR